MKVKQLVQPVAALVGAAAILFGVSALTQALSAQGAQAEQQRVMELLLPGSTVFTPEEYEGEDENITALFKGEGGYVVETVVPGYVDDMTFWVGVDSKGTVTGVTVRDMAESFGLGRKAMNDLPFLEQFLGTAGDAAVGENVDALTGATVTSKAAAKAVNSAAAFISGADVSSGATEWGG